MRVGFQFDPEWRTTVFTLVLLPLLMGLGFWQLQRADEKADLAQMWEQRQQQSPQPLSAVENVSAEALAYLPVTLEGAYLEGQYFLLDNRSRNRQFGNEVIALFRLAGSGQLVLVNRGWIAADAARRQLPEIPSPRQSKLSGSVYVAPGEPYLLGEQRLEQSWPQRIQAVDTGLISELVGEEVFPYPVRLSEHEPDALFARWPVVNVSADKHTGYAVQWFCMALALTIFYFLRSSNLAQWLRSKWRRERGTTE